LLPDRRAESEAERSALLARLAAAKDRNPALQHCSLNNDSLLITLDHVELIDQIVRATLSQSNGLLARSRASDSFAL
jgi:hypothetical protein